MFFLTVKINSPFYFSLENVERILFALRVFATGIDPSGFEISSKHILKISNRTIIEEPSAFREVEFKHRKVLNSNAFISTMFARP